MPKKKELFNSYENHADELLYEVWGARDCLTKRAKQAITRVGVISIYPNGANHAKAISDADSAQCYLVAAIGAYDTARMAYNDYIMENAEKFDTVRKNWTTTSHEIIEWAYESYYNKE